MLKPIVAGLLAGAAISASSLPVSAQPSPVRWNSGAAVWTTKFSDFNDFLKSKDSYSGERGLSSGLAASGWTAKEVQDGLSKTYNVDLVGVSRYLYSKDGVKFLQDQTRSYFPYWAQKSTAVQALRSAIILASADGKLSSAGIMKNLPVDFRLADTCSTFDGKQNICAKGKCKGEAQCSSLLSWYVFLPACIQANQVLDKVTARSGGAPAAVRGLW
jgi:hypothetical protein